MRPGFSFSFLCVVAIIQCCSFVEAFHSISPNGLIESPSRIASNKVKTYRASLLGKESDDTEGNKFDSEDDEAIDDDDSIEDLPMFVLDYNSDNVDYSQLPVPPFTSALVLIVTTVFTIYTYYVGLTGGIATGESL